MKSWAGLKFWLLSLSAPLAFGLLACDDASDKAESGDELGDVIGDSDSVGGDVAQGEEDGDISSEEDSRNGGEEDGSGLQEALCEYEEPRCSDQQVSYLELKDVANTRGIEKEEREGDVFISSIDATAGARPGSLDYPDGYVYARFTEDGLEVVSLSDEEALEDMDWDIAFRRYIARLNSGVSGPSCVTGARVPPSLAFEAFDALPEGLTFRKEQYFTEGSCDYVPEPSGIGSPQTITSSYWAYASCLSMTGNVYVVSLRDGQYVKMEFLSYYKLDKQEECDRNGSISGDSGAGHVTLKWAFIDP